MDPELEAWQKEFEDTCLKAYGLILTGVKRHLCPDWDFLPIDETCEEFTACWCYGNPKERAP